MTLEVSQNYEWLQPINKMFLGLDIVTALFSCCLYLLHVYVH